MKKWCSIAYRVFMDSKNLKLWLISQILKKLKMTVASLYYDEESCIKILSQESTELRYNSVSSMAKQQHTSNVCKRTRAGAAAVFCLPSVFWEFPIFLHLTNMKCS